MFHIDANHPTPLYAQLERSIRFAIATGKLRIGEQLPTVRQLAVDLRINANTVAKVYAELERTGIVETQRGVGTFVCVRHFDAKQKRQHGNELRYFSDRVVAEAGSMGFSLADLVDQLKSRRERSRGNV